MVGVKIFDGKADPLDSICRLKELFRRDIRKFALKFPKSHDQLLLELPPLRGKPGKMKFLSENVSIVNIVEELKRCDSMLPNARLLNNIIVPPREAVYVQHISSTKLLYSHQHSAISLLCGKTPPRAVVMKTSTSSGKSLVYQVSYQLI